MSGSSNSGASTCEAPKMGFEYEYCFLSVRLGDSPFSKNLGLETGKRQEIARCALYQEGLNLPDIKFVLDLGGDSYILEAAMDGAIEQRDSASVLAAQSLLEKIAVVLQNYVFESRFRDSSKPTFLHLMNYLLEHIPRIHDYQPLTQFERVSVDIAHSRILIGARPDRLVHCQWNFGIPIDEAFWAFPIHLIQLVDEPHVLVGFQNRLLRYWVRAHDWVEERVHQKQLFDAPDHLLDRIRFLIFITILDGFVSKFWTEKGAPRVKTRSDIWAADCYGIFPKLGRFSWYLKSDGMELADQLGLSWQLERWGIPPQIDRSYEYRPYNTVVFETRDNETGVASPEKRMQRTARLLNVLAPKHLKCGIKNVRFGGFKPFMEAHAGGVVRAVTHALSYQLCVDNALVNSSEHFKRFFAAYYGFAKADMERPKFLIYLIRMLCHADINRENPAIARILNVLMDPIDESAPKRGSDLKRCLSLFSLSTIAKTRMLFQLIMEPLYKIWLGSVNGIGLSDTKILRLIGDYFNTCIQYRDQTGAYQFYGSLQSSYLIKVFCDAVGNGYTSGLVKMSPARAMVARISQFNQNSCLRPDPATAAP